MPVTRLTRVCAMSAHDKCLGGYDSPRGFVSCVCACHDTLPTLWSDLDEERG